MRFIHHKIPQGLSLFILILLFFSACLNNTDKGMPDSNNKTDFAKTDSNLYNGVFKSYRDGYLYSEVRLTNGKKNGLSVRYYREGGINTHVIYENGIKVDTSKWFYSNGKIYRETPYKLGKIHGIQRKYHKDGSILAEIPYMNGKRRFGLKEFSQYGNEVINYPSIVIKNEDLRSSNNIYIIHLRLSNNAKRVKFYRGSAVNETIDIDKLEYLLTQNGQSHIRFVEKPGFTGKKEIQLIAEYITRAGNKKYIRGKLILPAANLKY